MGLWLVLQGVSRFSTSCRDVLPTIETRATYSGAGLKTTVHYTLAPKPHLTKHTSMSRTRGAEKKEPELLRTSSRGAKDGPSTPKGLRKAPSEMSGIGEGDVAPPHDPTGLSAMIRKMVADHQAGEGAEDAIGTVMGGCADACHVGWNVQIMQGGPRSLRSMNAQMMCTR